MKKKKCKGLSHKWENIYRVYDSEFLFEIVKEKDLAFRRCKRCGCVQEREYGRRKMRWEWLSPARTKVFNDKIKEGQTEINEDELYKKSVTDI